MAYYTVLIPLIRAHFLLEQVEGLLFDIRSGLIRCCYAALANGYIESNLFDDSIALTIPVMMCMEGFAMSFRSCLFFLSGRIASDMRKNLNFTRVVIFKSDGFVKSSCLSLKFSIPCPRTNFLICRWSLCSRFVQADIRRQEYRRVTIFQLFVNVADSVKMALPSGKLISKSSVFYGHI